MDRRALIVALTVAGASFSANAYVSPSPPAGFGGTSGAWTFTPPSAAEQVGKIMRGPGPKIPGGPTVGGAYRLGGGAARALAGGVARSLIPGVGLALGVAWLASNCFAQQGGKWVRTCFTDDNGQPYTPPQSDGYMWLASISANGVSNTPKTTREEACRSAVTIGSAQIAPSHYEYYSISTTGGPSNYGWCFAQSVTPAGVRSSAVGIAPFSRGVASNCPAGWYVTPAGCVSSLQPQVVTVEEIEEQMAPKPMPQQLPPGFPYPLDPSAPFIFNPDTGNPPNAQPLRVPQGNPVPVPNTNPQQYRQPVTRFTPAPTAQDPFRLDVRPEDLVTTSPTGMTDPTPVTPTTPSGEQPEQFDLCKEHPDILACQVFKPDDLEPLPIPNKDKALAITPDSGWGASGASCPANKTASLSFGPIAFSYEPLCLFANGIRPMVIALAWFSAALTFFGFARKDT